MHFPTLLCKKCVLSEPIAIEDTTFRVYFHNIKGLHLQRTSSDLMFNLESMRDIEASVFGWAETNTNWNQEDALAEYRDKASQEQDSVLL